MNAINTLFVNAGILGHRSVAQLIREAADRDAAINAHHLDLGTGLTYSERIIRRVVCLRPFGAIQFNGTNLDFARWRHEYHSGMIASRRIRRLCRTDEFDVLHFHTQACAYASLRRMERTPSIVSIDATQGLASKEAPSQLERWTYWPNIAHDGHVFRRAAAIISTSKWAADDLATTYPDCARKVHVLPYPVKLNCFDSNWSEKRLDRSARLASRPVTFLFIGGDFPRKGGFDLLEAWRKGRFESRARLILVTGYDLSKHTLPPGVSVQTGIEAYTQSWHNLWQEADAFVMPTRGEAFGMVYQEAAAAGLPTIATDINAVPEIVTHNKTGLLTPVGQIDALVAAITSLCDSAELRHQMGQAGREKMECQARPRDYSEKLCHLIHQVAGRATERQAPSLTLRNSAA